MGVKCLHTSYSCRDVLTSLQCFNQRYLCIRGQPNLAAKLNWRRSSTKCSTKYWHTSTRMSVILLWPMWCSYLNLRTSSVSTDSSLCVSRPYSITWTPKMLRLSCSSQISTRPTDWEKLQWTSLCPTSIKSVKVRPLSNWLGLMWTSFSKYLKGEHDDVIKLIN